MASVAAAGLLRGLALVLMVATCVSSYVYDFTLTLEHAASCVESANTHVSCSSTSSWTSVAGAEEQDASAASVTFGAAECSEYLVCRDYRADFPALSATWDNVDADDYVVHLYYNATENADANVALSTTTGSITFSDRDIMISDLSTSATFQPARYGLFYKLPDLDNANFGVYLWLEQLAGGSVDVDYLQVDVLFEADADIDSIQPSGDVDIGTTITLVGTFFDTRDLGETPICMFFGSTGSGFSFASSISSTEMTCDVPDLGSEAGTFDVTATLRNVGEAIVPGEQISYAPGSGGSGDDDDDGGDGGDGGAEEEENDDDPSDVPGGTTTLQLDPTTLALLVSGGAVGLIGAGIVLVKLRAESSSAAAAAAPSASPPSPPAAANKSTPSNTMDSLDAVATAGATKPTSSLDRKRRPSAPVVSSSSSKNAGSGSTHSVRRARTGSAPAPRRRQTYDTIPMSKLVTKRDSMRTQASVTSEHAPFFG